MKAPIGSVVRLTYDSPMLVAPGDALLTGAGRVYMVESARLQTRGRHRCRWHLRCVVAEWLRINQQSRVHRLYWYPRRRVHGQKSAGIGKRVPR